MSRLPCKSRGKVFLGHMVTDVMQMFGHYKIWLQGLEHPLWAWLVHVLWPRKITNHEGKESSMMSLKTRFSESLSAVR